MSDFLDFTVKIEPQSNNRCLLTISGIRRPDIFACHVIRCRRDGGIPAAEVEKMIPVLWAEWARQNLLKRRKSLTRAMQRMYGNLLDFWKQEGRAPTYEELAMMAGYKERGTAYQTVSELVRRGWVWRDENKHPVPVDLLPPDINKTAG